MPHLMKLAVVALTFLSLFIFSLWPTWTGPVGGLAPASQAQVSQVKPHLVTSPAVITFTPVATIYLPAVTRNDGSPGPAPTTPPEPAIVKIIRIEYDPATGPDVEGEYVDIQNLGQTALDLTDWTLRDEANAVFTFPSYSLSGQAKVRVWVRAGVSDTANLYWGRGSAVWNNGGDTATLRNAEDEEVDTCIYPGGAPGFFDCN